MELALRLIQGDPDQCSDSGASTVVRGLLPRFAGGVRMSEKSRICGARTHHGDADPPIGSSHPPHACL